ncbi:protein O-mannosyl-transferase Tmtc3-like [Lutzomyia longipalpis]|uniref:protein O-mannosyl-transferase Tmtc3-like n=1 Tax=Lutzomyia longipalpis TaxID=7200 RepID=UPI002483B8B0|nr:protein O-mannosyl-transferase Tmtc3-like [Lutzomyia longipalpis]
MPVTMSPQHFFGFIIAITCIVCYHNSLNCGFVFDDISAIKENKDLRPHTPWKNIFFNDFWGTPMQKEQSHKSYRPLCVLTFRWNYSFHGLEPAGYHLVNLLLHTLVSLMYFRMCTMFLPELMSFAAAMLFAVHPVHTEAVTGVVGRAETLSSVFFLAAFLSYAKATELKKSTGWKHLFLSSIFVGTAMLCKEQGITVTGVCAIYEIFVAQKIRLSDLQQLCRAILGGKSVSLPSGSWPNEASKRLAVLCLSTIGLLFVRLQIMGSQLPVFTSSFVFSLQKQLGVVFLEQGKASQALAYLDKALEFDPEHEQALLNSAILLQELGRVELRKIARERLLKLLAIDDKNDRVFFNLGMLAMDDRNIEEAENWFRRAVHLKHDFRSALFNLALLLADDHRPLEAAPFLNQLVKYHPDHIKGLILLGDIYINNIKDLDAAENCYKQILQLDPVNIQGLHNLCVVYVERGKLLQAQACLKHAHRLAPTEDYILRHLQIIQSRVMRLKQTPGADKERELAFSGFDPREFGGDVKVVDDEELPSDVTNNVLGMEATMGQSLGGIGRNKVVLIDKDLISESKTKAKPLVSNTKYKTVNSKG